MLYANIAVWQTAYMQLSNNVFRKRNSLSVNRSNTVIGTVAVDGWAVTFGTARRKLGGAAARPGLLAVPNVTAHPSTASVPTSY